MSKTFVPKQGDVIQVSYTPDFSDTLEFNGMREFVEITKGGFYMVNVGGDEQPVCYPFARPIAVMVLAWNNETTIIKLRDSEVTSDVILIDRVVSEQNPLLVEFIKMSENGKYICDIEFDEELSVLTLFDNVKPSRVI